MSVHHPRDLNVTENHRGSAIQSTTGVLFGLDISDWLFLLAGVGISAVILLFI
jgi:hypothetical protein